MLATTLLGAFSTLSAYLGRYRNSRWGLALAFCLIGAFLGLRYDFGNDYHAYLDAFNGASDLYMGLEPGWPYLTDIFRPLGFFAMIAALAVANSIVYYRFIKQYVPPNLYWFAVGLYVLNPDFMLIHSTAMRQAVAIMLFVHSIDYVRRRKLVPYVLCIGLAALFHVSALIVLPVYLFGAPGWRLGTAKSLIIVALYAGLFLFADVLAGHLSQFVGAYFARYAKYEDAGVVGSGLGFAFLSAMFAITLYFAHEQSGERGVIFNIAVISFLLMPLSLLVELSARLGMYFAPATLATYPIILTRVKSSISKAVYLALLVAFVAYKYVTFFYSDTWKDAFGVYHSIFSVGQWQ